MSAILCSEKVSFAETQPNSVGSEQKKETEPAAQVRRGPWVNAFYDTYKVNRFVEQNVYLTMPQEDAEVPTFESSKHLLPEPVWENHKSAIDCYWKTWQLAFKNLRKLDPESGFVANYIDTAFNDCIFMWDTCFILMFARYGSRAFSFLRTLDNFYSKQHKDGFICRQIGKQLGDDRFQRFDPTSTGPELMPWTEWEYYRNLGDKDRLSKIFPVLVAYHQWMRDYRTWRDGSYWASGWACGMDNQPRMGHNLPGYVEMFYHDHMVWVDTCLQGILAADILIQMAKELGREDDISDLKQEIDNLTRIVNTKLWDQKTKFYYDLHKDDKLSDCKSIAAFWALLAGAVPPNRLKALLAHLENPKEFNRAHRVPTLSADDPTYNPNGGYWKGSVWPPTNYMILRGLTRVGEDKLAYEIARNHHNAVVKTFEDTGTVFENYAPDHLTKGNPAGADFVGWGGVPPVAVFLEYVIGLQANVPDKQLIWNVNLLEEHGVKNYPFGMYGTLDLLCKARTSAAEKPNLTVKSSVPLDLEVRWSGGSETLHVEPS